MDLRVGAGGLILDSNGIPRAIVTASVWRHETLLTSFRKDLCLGGGIYNPARVSVAPYQTLALKTSQADSVRYELDRSRGDDSRFIKSQPQACDPPKERIQIIGPSKLTESKADVQV